MYYIKLYMEFKRNKIWHKNMFRNISHDSISLVFSFFELNDLNKIKLVSKEMKKIIEDHSHLIRNATKNELLEDYPRLDEALYYNQAKNFNIDWIYIYENKSNSELINLVQSLYNKEMNLEIYIKKPVRKYNIISLNQITSENIFHAIFYFHY